MPTKRPPVETIRWMIRRDSKRALEIDSQVFRPSWTEDDLVRTLRQRNAIGMVFERDEHILGYMVYELHKNRFELMRLAVDRWEQRSGIGTKMVQKLVNKLSAQQRDHIDIAVPEKLLGSQLFFRYLGFRAVSIVPDSDGDSYSMRFTLPRDLR